MNTPTPGWQPPSSPTPPQKRRSKRKIILGTVFGIFALFVVVSVIAAIVSPQKSGSPKAAISALPQATTASVAPTPAAPTLSAGEAKFVRTVKAAMQAHGDELTSRCRPADLLDPRQRRPTVNRHQRVEERPEPGGHVR